ncbi:MAG: hypothetical protein HQM08_01640 [Candidatus Riflebacteria bacterium]|nr:hypothetical protein [Candidatus Riflebacteria bacterium]
MFETNRKNNSLRKTFVICLILFLSGFIFPNVSLAEKPSSSIKDKIIEVSDSCFQNLGNLIIDKSQKLVNALNSTGKTNLEIHSSFYDQDYRRVFISFHGAFSFQGELPWKLNKNQWLVTADGDIAYDLTFTQVAAAKGLAFNVEGVFVVSLNSLLLDMVKLVPLSIGALNYAAAEKLLENFLSFLKIEILAKGISETLTNFSLYSLSRSTAEVVAGASKLGKQSLADLVTKSATNGGMLEFAAVTLIHSAVITGADLAGGSLGAIVGNFLAPGPGAVVGLFLGSQITRLLASTIVFELVTDLPIAFFLNRIAKSGEVLLKCPNDEVQCENYKSYSQKVLQKIGRDFDNEKYLAFDTVLDRIGKYGQNEKIFFQQFLQALEEKLRFKLIDQKDWYAGKKMLQLRGKMKEWGIPDPLDKSK